MNNSVRTRIAPSPTGDLHVGTLATILKNYAFAHKNNGQFILRIEDTDKQREQVGGVAEIQRIIKSFGLNWDEGPDTGGPYEPYLQSERLPIYLEAAQQLIDENKAYYCFATSEELAEMREEAKKNKLPPKYDGRYRHYPVQEALARVRSGEPHVIRLKVPENQTVSFTDLIRGDISFKSDQVDDQILIKSDGYPTYHLAVVVDDHAMKISHVMRGEEWISSTPKHVLLYQAFNWPLPIFAHIPIFLNPDGKGKMSKRLGTVSAQSFIDRGYLKDALLNFLMILGWTPHDQRELVSLREYIAEFDPKDISKNSVAFDYKKLDWINGIYIRQLSIEELLEALKPFLPHDFQLEKAQEILPLVRERLITLADIEDLTDFFYRSPKVSSELLLRKSSAEEVSGQLELTNQALLKTSSWSCSELEKQVRHLQEVHAWSKKQYFMMLRIALTGKSFTPPLFETMAVLGKEETINRLTQARSSLT